MTVTGVVGERVVLRTQHSWQDDIALSVDVFGSVNDGERPCVLRASVEGRLKVIPSWYRVAAGILALLSRPGLELLVQVPETFLQWKSGSLMLADDVWSCLGGTLLNTFDVSVQSSCVLCGVSVGIEPRFCPSRGGGGLYNARVGGS